MTTPSLQSNTEIAPRLIPEPGADPAARTNILLVDDRADGLLSLEVVLRSPGLNLVKATSGEEALMQLLEKEFAVILLDVQMPGMDGFETAKLIKTHERFRHIPIIFVTGIHGDQRFVTQGYEVGAIDYVCKPFEPYILKSKVSVLVDLYRKTQLLREMQEKVHQKTLYETRHKLEEEFQVRERRLISLVENSADFIAITDRTHRLAYLNPAGRELVGLPPEDEQATRSILDFFPASERVKIEDIFTKEGKQEYWESELALQHFNTGTLMPVWAKGFPIKDPATGEVDAFAMISRDIREKKGAEETLKNSERRFRTLAEELLKANAELQQFAWVASHDLKEPLRVVSSYVALLRRSLEGSMEPEIKEYIDFVVDGASRMRSLIDGLLSFSSVSSQQGQTTRVDCNRVFDLVLSNLEILIKENQAKVTRDELPTVLADPTQIGQLLQNLVANGIKFRQNQPPEIHISARKDGNDWTFMVKDNGIGIESQYLTKIFGVFQRLHSAEEYPGAGVGLAICKKIIDRHCGNIWADSIPGEGSSFYFTLPDKRSTLAEQATRH